MLSEEQLKELRERAAKRKELGFSTPIDSDEVLSLISEVEQLRSSQNGGWIEIPNDDTELGDCFVGRFYPRDRFRAFQRDAPCTGWIERQNYFTHYKPIQPPLIEHPSSPLPDGK